MDARGVNMLGGFKVVIVKDTVYPVKRTWKQRLFTLPWTPLVKTRDEVHNVLEKGQIIKDCENNILYMKQEAYDKLLKLELT